MTEYNAPQIVALVKAGKGPSGLFSGSDQAAKMSQLHQEIAEEMRQLQGAMEQHWEGNAAGKAYSGAGPLVQASQVSGEHLAKAQNLYTGQGNSYQPLKSTVDSVGDLGERPSDDWVSGTPLSFLSNRSDEIAKWDEKAKRVVDSYSTYHDQSTDNSGQWPQQYGELGLPASGADIQPKVDDGPGPGPGPGPGQPGPGRKRTDETGGETVPPPGGGSRHDVSGSQDANGPTGSENRPGEHKPGEQSGSDGDGKTHTPADTKPSQTTPTEYLPPNTPGGIPPKDPTYTPTGYGNPNGPSNGPGAFPVGGGVPGGGGYDSSRGGAGTGKPGGQGNLGGGKGSGVGTFGQQGPAAARPGAIAGKPGAPGMGGAPMGRGQKEEDGEHERPAYLIEEDPDDAFVGELPKTSPPVIGA
ncbi:hypothetical protein [Amycolatopsis sp. NPDC059657]|uniref:hypothetical protein n=1 Tax=Amycolatopsis sp. NPDC059657 TaxID=3346899 RepID=UPI003671DEAF